MKVLLISLFISSISTQDIEGCVDLNALNYDNNLPTMEEDEYADWLNHCDSCSDEPFDGLYNPVATINDNSCQYSQVLKNEEMVFTPTFGEINIDWSVFEPSVDEINILDIAILVKIILVA